MRSVTENFSTMPMGHKSLLCVDMHLHMPDKMKCECATLFLNHTALNYTMTLT